ncbi:MAG TPA: hypothetical protein VIG48_13485 [Jatrophihabitans sp.]|jgi:hypothetical protein
MVWAAAAALLAAVTVASAAHGSTPARRTLTHTASVVVRPVTWTARVAPGFTVSRERTGRVDCTAGMASPGAVDRDILQCSPSAEYATACWLSRTPHHVLCLRDPRSKHLVSLPRHGVMAQTLPYGITYYCQHGQAIWAPFSATNWGIERSHPVWTVRTAPASGHGALRTRNVAKAWFVGMHS